MSTLLDSLNTLSTSLMAAHSKDQGSVMVDQSEDGSWEVIGTESGFSYCSYSDKTNAEHYAETLKVMVASHRRR